MPVFPFYANEGMMLKKKIFIHLYVLFMLTLSNTNKCNAILFISCVWLSLLAPLADLLAKLLFHRTAQRTNKKPKAVVRPHSSYCMSSSREELKLNPKCMM